MIVVPWAAGYTSWPSRIRDRAHGRFPAQGLPCVYCATQGLSSARHRGCHAYAFSGRRRLCSVANSNYFAWWASSPSRACCSFCPSRSNWRKPDRGGHTERRTPHDTVFNCPTTTGQLPPCSEALGKTQTASGQTASWDEAPPRGGFKACSMTRTPAPNLSTAKSSKTTEWQPAAIPVIGRPL